jgi:hypothetical protein
MTRALLLAVVIAGCAAERADVEPLGEYTAWKKLETYGKTPGHGDTYRIIYANDVAEMFNQAEYGVGTVLVKEVYNLAPGGGPGSLRVIEIARRLDTAPADQDGWLFTDASTPGGVESVKDFCWRRCHTAAPFAGAWFDYSAPRVAMTSPTNGATNVAVTAPVTVTFSESVISSTISASSFTLRQGTTPVAGTITTSSVTASITATFTPDAPLLSGTVYTGEVTTAVEDLTRNPFKSSFQFSFTTAP